MNLIHRTYKFQLLPNREQKVLLNKHFGSVRYVYNYFLNERKEQYQADKKTDNYYKQAKAGLSRSIADVSWSAFVRFVEYKANWNNKTVVKINRFYPSSKTCNVCGYINQDLNLSIRKWTCPKCSTELDRDENASINILKEGLKILNSAGTVENKGGEKNKTFLKHISVKPEAHTSLVCG